MDGPTSFSGSDSAAVPSGGFEYEPTDVNNIIDPNTGNERIVRNIITTVEGVIKVTYLDGSIDIVPVLVGSNPMLVRKIWETDTTAGITAAKVHCQY